MSGGHAHGLFIHKETPVHALPAQCKIVAACFFVVVVALTPREQVGLFALFLGLVICAFVVSQVSVGFMFRRLAMVLPFLACLLAVPFVADGETVQLLGSELSIEGLWIVWNVAIKAVLGLGAVVLLAATTTTSDLLRGMERLRVPRILLAIAGFMLRYADVVTGELRRMQIARASRGQNTRWLWQTKALASSVGSLFIRSFERGERIHTAMISRGFKGSMPRTAQVSVPGVSDWSTALVIPCIASVALFLGAVV